MNNMTERFIKLREDDCKWYCNRIKKCFIHQQDEDGDPLCSVGIECYKYAKWMKGRENDRNV